MSLKAKYSLQIAIYKFHSAIVRRIKSTDSGILYSLVALIIFGVLLLTAASPGASARIGVSENFFITRQIMFLLLATVCMTVISMLDRVTIRRLALLGFIFNVLLLVVVKFYGYEIKGAKRWINILGVSLQPSEFIKPFFFVLSGWVLSVKFDNNSFPAVTISFVLYILVALLLLIQPDIGMLLLISSSWMIQIFVCGMPFLVLAISGVVALCAIWLSYIFLPHVAHRINSFLSGDISNNYQVSKSILAYEKGGLGGLGPGEGVIKHSLPDSHTDFIFAVAGEEFGSITCIIIVCLFAFIISRVLFLMTKENDQYVVLSSLGIICSFAMQAVINISVTLNLMPTKGMTLPFISYGGSSMIAMAINMGIILSFTRKKVNPYKYDILKSLQQ